MEGKVNQERTNIMKDIKTMQLNNYLIAIVNLIWIIIQNVYVGVFWKKEHSFAYPAPLIMLLNSITPILLILGSAFYVCHFLVLTQLLCYMCIILACISLLCMIIVIPQMNTFYNQCISGFPTEDCHIYNFHYMWPILVMQSIFDIFVVIIKIGMLYYSYHLYLLIHEYKSPLLKYIQNNYYFNMKIPGTDTKKTLGKTTNKEIRK